MLNTIEAALSDMKEEFVVLLGACPRLNRQPYCAYLFMERCMFGRQMEKEQIIGFLLQPAQDFDVLPIIGPHEVGKRTLVEHACVAVSMTGCEITSPRFTISQVTVLIYRAMTTMVIIKA